MAVRTLRSVWHGTVLWAPLRQLLLAVLDMWHSTCACLYVLSNVPHMTGPWSIYFLTRRHNTISRVSSYYKEWCALKQKPKPVRPPFPDNPAPKELPSLDRAGWCVSATYKFKNIMLPDDAASSTFHPDLWKSTLYPASQPQHHQWPFRRCLLLERRNTENFDHEAAEHFSPLQLTLPMDSTETVRSS
jgi:hypothetical protein